MIEHVRTQLLSPSMAVLLAALLLASACTATGTIDTGVDAEQPENGDDSTVTSTSAKANPERTPPGFNALKSSGCDVDRDEVPSLTAEPGGWLPIDQVVAAGNLTSIHVEVVLGTIINENVHRTIGYLSVIPVPVIEPITVNSTSP